LSQPEIYSLEEVQEIADKIKNIHLDISNRTHVKNITQMKKNIDRNICPRCGAELVSKTGKYGTFYGCSNYPKCKFIKKETEGEQ
jgi:ssDNA-binding Zn-finger/Zn-ribbon topoisomerase 1